MLNMTAKWKWIPLISGALLVLFAGQTRLQAADAHDGLRDYLKKKMHELGIPGMQVAVVRHQKIVFLEALGIAEVGNENPGVTSVVVKLSLPGIPLFNIPHDAAGDIDRALETIQIANIVLHSFKGTTTECRGLDQIVLGECGDVVAVLAGKAADFADREI